MIPLFTIFILVLIISAGYLTQLFPCKLQKILNENIYVKHLFGLFTLVFFVLLSAPIDEKSIDIIIPQSVLLYMYFIIVTKTNKYIFLLILLLLGITYLIVLKTAELKDKKERKLGDAEIQQYDNIVKYIYGLVILLTIVGVMLYMGEKKMEYKKNFNYTVFLFGKPECNNSIEKTHMIDNLKHFMD
jgi:hypothetical protein